MKLKWKPCLLSNLCVNTLLPSWVKICYISWLTDITKVSNSKSDLQPLSRSLAVMPSDKPYMIFSYFFIVTMSLIVFSALMLLVGWREAIQPVKKWVVGCWSGCLWQGTYLHMSELIQLPLTTSCSCKSRLVFTFLVPAHPGSPRLRAVKRVLLLL